MKNKNKMEKLTPKSPQIAFSHLKELGYELSSEQKAQYEATYILYEEGNTYNLRKAVSDCLQSSNIEDHTLALLCISEALKTAFEYKSIDNEMF